MLTLHLTACSWQGANISSDWRTCGDFVWRTLWLYMRSVKFTPQYFAIHIPRLYPGFPAHKRGDHNMLRLMFITWVRTMLLLDSYCEYVSSGKRTPPPVTREFHEGVLERLREREQQADLAQRLCEARNVVEQSLSSTGRGTYQDNGTY